MTAKWRKVAIRRNRKISLKDLAVKSTSLMDIIQMTIHPFNKTPQEPSFAVIGDLS